jgi:hypothetical protein
VLMPVLSEATKIHTSNSDRHRLVGLEKSCTGGALFDYTYSNRTLRRHSIATVRTWVFAVLLKTRMRFPRLDDSDRRMCPADVRRLAICAISDLLAAPNQDTEALD